MKRIILSMLAAITLAACATTPECAIKNPDGTCACKVVDENGDCVEGGGPGVIVQGGNN